MELIPLAAGPLRMVFDPQLAFLRYIRYDDIEIVRGIYVAVRDKAWNNVPSEVVDLQVDASYDHFSLAWRAKCASDEIAFEWRCTVTGSAKGTIAYAFDGQARNSLLKNRIGICLLHPIRECAGQRCSILHSDGTATDAAFPNWISPHQPFTNIRSIQHTVRPGAVATITFEGDDFEMEDQRNWTDASFKTYSTPLSRPYPEHLEVGARIKQSATVEVRTSETGITKTSSSLDQRSKRSELPDDAVRIRVDWNASRMLPSIGLSMAHVTAGKPSEAVIVRLREAGLSHLRVDVGLGTSVWRERLREALQLAEQIDVRLEVAVFCNTSQESVWRDCLEQLAGHRHRIARWLILPTNGKTTPNELVAALHQELLAFDVTIPIAFGTDANFAQLNRGRPVIPDDALVCYSIHPQMHANDKLSLCETLEGQAATVDSAYEFFQREVVISPITLRPRVNWSAASSADRANPTEPPADHRQSSGFAAAWTVGSISQLAANPYVASVTYYEIHGPRGIMDSFGNPYGAHSVFSAMSGYQRICSAASSHPLEVMGIALVRNDGSRGIIIGNLGSRPRTVVVESTYGRVTQIALESERVTHVSNYEVE